MEERYFESKQEERKYKTIKIVKDVILYLVLTFFALFTLIPFMWMVFSAFK